jgi:hypothetical protein
MKLEEETMWWWVHEWHDTLKHPQRCSVFDPAKIFLTSKFICFFFPPTPSIQLKLEPQIGGRLLIANHLDQSLWLVDEKQGAAVRSYLLHSSLASVRLCCAFYQRQQTLQKWWIKTILLSQTQHVLTFLCPILMSKVTYWAHHSWGCS